MMPDVVPQEGLVPMPHGIIDRRRGTWAMVLFIVTEASLFVMLFFTYYYFGSGWRGPWPPEPPKMMLALIMLAILLTSSIVLHAGELAERRGHKRLARALVGATILIGAGFIGVQALEYREHLKTLTPLTNAYGSIFYTITGFHAAHVVLGLLMLCYVMILPEIGPAEKPPHHALHNASLYWHFVDAVWIVIVTLLYVMPNLGR
jgi:heme/copper-type cytochrome/quinol oxidase subunit 3